MVHQHPADWPRRNRRRSAHVVAAGIVAGIDQLGLAAGMIAVTVLLLAEKPRLHAIVRRPTLLAAIRFAVMSVVVLPLLPEGPYGPAPGIRPRALWLLVLLFSGLSFAGFVGRRLAGRAAYPVTGLLGGLVSSTSVTLTFARLSRTDDRNSSALAAGAVAACTILFVRVAVAITVLNRGLLAAVSWYLMPPFLVGVLALLVGWRAAPASSDEPAVLNNPLQFRAAIEMAALFQLVLFAVDFARRYLGTGGLLATGFVLGLTDVDALTISMARSAATGTSAQIAARAIALGILANTLVKLGIALTVGRRRFTGHAGIPLVVMAAILWALIAA